MRINLQHRGAADDLGASYASLFSELCGSFRARGMTSEEARDLAQESLVRTFVHLKRHGQTQPDLRPLAHTIAKRLYVERGRRVRPHFVDLPEAEQIPDPAPQPAEAVVAMEEQREVQAALRCIAPRHRRVISLWMSGLRPAEIARELGIKRNAADALLHRARRQLATKLDPSRAAFGLIGVIVVRLRAGARRMVDAVASLDPSGSVTQAGAGLAAVAIAAVLLASAPVKSGVGADGHRASGITVGTAEGPASRAQVGDAPAAATESAASPVRVDKVEHRVSLGAGVGPGEGDKAETWLIYRDDGSEQPSKLGPMIDPLVEGLCETGAGLCQSFR